MGWRIEEGSMPVGFRGRSRTVLASGKCRHGVMFDASRRDGSTFDDPIKGSKHRWMIEV